MEVFAGRETISAADGGVDFMSMRNLPVETILDPAPGLAAEFRYPEGYFMPLGRVTAPAVLAKFPEALRPFVVAPPECPFAACRNQAGS